MNFRENLGFYSEVIHGHVNKKFEEHEYCDPRVADTEREKGISSTKFSS